MAVSFTRTRRTALAMSDRADDTDATAGTETRTGTGTRVDEGPDPRDESTQVADEERRRNAALVSGVTAIIGAWVALSVLLYEVTQASLWNNVLVGAVVFVAAGYNFYRLNNDIPLSVGVAALVALLGIWLIVAAAVFAMIGMLFWSTSISGLLIAALAGYNAYEAREARTVTAEGEPESS